MISKLSMLTITLIPQIKAGTDIYHCKWNSGSIHHAWEFPDVQNIPTPLQINLCSDEKITITFDFSHPSIRNQLP